mgnify:CR=1 FL=1
MKTFTIPKNEVAETAVIAKLLLDGDRIVDVAEILDVDDFYCYTNRISNAKIYEKMLELYQKNEKINPVSMASMGFELHNMVEIASGEVTAGDIKAMVERIKQASVKRKMLSGLQKAMVKCQSDTDYNEVLKDLSDIQVGYTKMKSNVDVIKEYEDFVKLSQLGAEKGILGFSTGLEVADKFTFGLIPTHIWVVGGYYGSGKSYLGLNIANSVLKQGGRVVMINLEMSNNECIQRLIALNANAGTLDVLKKEKEDIILTSQEMVLHDFIGTNRLIMNEELSNDRDIENFVRATCHRYKVDLILIDYIQLIEGRVGASRYEALANAVTNLQKVAKKFNVTVMMLSQISNEAQKEDQKSLVDGFKGAGEIGQVANVAIRIFRERGEDGNWTDEMKLSFRKVRHNHGGTVSTQIVFPGGKITGEEYYTVPADKLFTKQNE